MANKSPANFSSFPTGYVRADMMPRVIYLMVLFAPINQGVLPLFFSKVLYEERGWIHFEDGITYLCFISRGNKILQQFSGSSSLV